MKTAFGKWVDRHRFSVRDVVEILGISKNSVVKWRRVEAPRHILLACAAYSMGLDPVQ